MDTSFCYLVLFQKMQIMVQCTDGPREQLAWICPRYIQHMANCHAPVMALLLDAMHHIWSLTF